VSLFIELGRANGLNLGMPPKMERKGWTCCEEEKKGGVLETWNRSKFW